MSAATTPVRVLIVDDEPAIRRFLRTSLGAQGYGVSEAEDARTALDALRRHPTDVLVLDLGLPDVDGFEMIRRLRDGGSVVPIIVLSSRTDEAGKVKALDLGADDYMTKPFDLPEFEARVRALMRRGQHHATNVLRHGKLSLDLEARRVFHDGRPIDLSARELAVVELLMSRQGRVVTKEQMVDRLFGWGEDVGSNAIEVCVHRVRKKLEPCGVEIRTVRGMGYLMEKAGEAGSADAP
jgi:two-component system OmpR family response regulator